MVIELPRKTKPVHAVTDPDFEDNVPASTNYAIPDGTEFEQADAVLAFEDVSFPSKNGPVVIRMYDIDSSNLSAMGAKETTKDPKVVTLYVRFKSGASQYRYNPVHKADWNSLLSEAVKRHNGIQEASAGSLYHNIIKVPADEGTIKCQRLTEAGWTNVLPKAERTKQMKERVKGREVK